MTSLSKTSVVTIKQILQIEMKPKWMENILIREIKEGVKHQKLVARKDFLDQCIRRTICPSEIVAIARIVEGQDRSRNRKEEKRILRIRIDNLMEEIRESKARWSAETKRVNSVLGLSMEGSHGIKKARENELKLVWDRKKVRTNRKADKMDVKQNPTKRSNIPATYRQILIGDKELSDKYGETPVSVAI